MQFYFLTLFPEVFSEILNFSLMKRAQERGLVSFNYVALKEFADSSHRVDAPPYGGGGGMLLRSDVLYRAWKQTLAEKENVGTLLMSPQGQLLTQAKAHRFLKFSALILVCGHYEGVDQRFIDRCVDEEVSIGDYVLTGGELPALVLADTVTRLIPGVVGNSESLVTESLENGLLKYPQYTQPREWLGQEVPAVLRSGHHQQVALWRKEQSELQTMKKRPDLWEKWLKQT